MACWFSDILQCTLFVTDVLPYHKQTYATRRDFTQYTLISRWRRASTAMYAGICFSFESVALGRHRVRISHERQNYFFSSNSQCFCESVDENPTFAGAHNPRVPGNGLLTFKKFRLKCALKNCQISDNYPLKKRETPRNVWSLILFFNAHFKRNFSIYYMYCSTLFSSLNPDF